MGLGLPRSQSFLLYRLAARGSQDRMGWGGGEGAATGNSDSVHGAAIFPTPPVTSNGEVGGASF